RAACRARDLRADGRRGRSARAADACTRRHPRARAMRPSASGTPAAPRDRPPARASAAGSGTRWRGVAESRDRQAVLRACARTPAAAAVVGEWGLGIAGIGDREMRDPAMWTDRHRPLRADPQSPIPNPLASRSSVTRRTARQLLNLVLRDQLLAELVLVGRRSVVHAEDRLARPHVLLRVAMTVEAPLHLQRLLLHHQRHPIHLAVARGAADALVHVDAVVE